MSFLAISPQKRIRTRADSLTWGNMTRKAPVNRILLGGERGLPGNRDEEWEAIPTGYTRGFGVDDNLM